MELYKIINSFRRNYPAIEERTLKTLFMSDPTFKQTYRGLYVGRYGVWIANMYTNGYIKLGDIPELKMALVTYDKNKSQLPPIKDCKSLSELIEWVKNLSDDFKPVRNQSKAKAGLEKAYEDDEWAVYVPHSHEAARRGGTDTRWCTASKNNYYYNYYSKQGPLYINVRKSDGTKFQFHFESNQFMDANDTSAQLNEIGLSEGVVDFYTKIDPVFKFRLTFDWVDAFNEGFAEVILNGKCNFINTEGQLVSDQWFEDVWVFNVGFARVILNSKWNFINAEGQIVSYQWFDWACDFTDGFAQVKLNGKYNFINTKGQLLSNQWFNDTDYFRMGFARVIVDGKWNYINTEGQLLSQQGFDSVGNFNEGFAVVQLNGKYNFINTEGQYLFQQWLEWTRNFYEGFAQVKLNGKWNFINTKGQLLSKQWFTEVRDFDGGAAEVKLNGKWSLINTEGQILSQ